MAKPKILIALPTDDWAGSLVSPHSFRPRGWRFWICTHCYAPRSRHPRTEWVRSRPLNDHRHLDGRTLDLNQTNAKDKW